PKRDDELGVRAGDRFDVAWIRMDVVEENRLPFLDRGADETVANFQPERARGVFRITHRVGNRQLLTLGIEQVDSECMKLRQTSDELRDLAQQFIEIEHRRHLTPERD